LVGQLYIHLNITDQHNEQVEDVELVTQLLFEAQPYDSHDAFEGEHEGELQVELTQDQDHDGREWRVFLQSEHQGVAHNVDEDEVLKEALPGEVVGLEVDAVVLPALHEADLMGLAELPIDFSFVQPFALEQIHLE